MPPTPRLTASADLYRAHGLGNDYLVVDAGGDWAVTPANVAAVCHRLRGAGSDGVIVVGAREDGAFVLGGFNPDGSEFERSGNGLRIVAAWLFREGRVGREPFPVHIGGARGSRVTLEVHGREGGRYDVSVAMGRAAVGPEAVALDPGALEVGPGGEADPARGSGGGSAGEGSAAEDGVAAGEGAAAREEDAAGDGAAAVEGAARLAGPDGEALDVTPVAVGNPHLVVRGEPLDPGRMEELGRWLTAHPALAHGANVQLARPAGPRRLHALVWERGVGPTEASGTSACAVAVAAVHRGDVEPGPVEVAMAGGTLQVQVEAELEVTLRGPVEEVMTGRLCSGFLESLPDR